MLMIGASGVGKTAFGCNRALSMPVLRECPFPNEHKAKWFVGAALNTAEQSMASVMSTALSRLNAFLDTELEQLLCFDTEIDAETFCNQKSAIFVIMPEENPSATRS